jgi:arginase
MAKLRILGVPMDFGTSRRGVDMGPFATRYTDLRRRLERLGHEVVDGGNVTVPLREDAVAGTVGNARYLHAITDVCREVALATRAAVAEGRIPIVLGGDHSLATGSVAGAAAHFAARGERIGLIWVDAHGDLNTPDTSPSGSVHGMPLAHLLGHGDAALGNVGGLRPAVRARDVALVAVRDLDPGERDHIATWGVRAYTMRAIDERGIKDVVSDAVQVAGAETAGIWVSVDMDAVDPEDAPGVGTPVAGGLSYREAHTAMELIADSGKLIGLDLVEVNPVLDERNRTAALGAELVLSALGKKVL